MGEYLIELNNNKEIAFQIYMEKLSQEERITGTMSPGQSKFNIFRMRKKAVWMECSEGTGRDTRAAHKGEQKPDHSAFPGMRRWRILFSIQLSITGGSEARQ